MDLLKELGRCNVQADADYKEELQRFLAVAAEIKAGNSTGDPVVDRMVLVCVESDEEHLKHRREMLTNLEKSKRLSKGQLALIKSNLQKAETDPLRPYGFPEVCQTIACVRAFRKRLGRFRGRYVLETFDAYETLYDTVESEAPSIHTTGYAWGIIVKKGDVLLLDVDTSSMSGIVINTGGRHYRGNVMSPIDGRQAVCKGGIPYELEGGGYVFGREAMETVSKIERAHKAAGRQQGERPQV
jgi:hypothetical protein